MPARAPETKDFSSNIDLSITPPSKGQANNILILLHGLGDTTVAFTKLGQALNLPETLCIALRGPLPLPDVLDAGREGYHWGDDIVFDNASGGIDVIDVAYNKSIQVVLDEVILGVLVSVCGYSLRDIVIYGFGQGGTLGLCIAREITKRGLEPSEMGGVVSVGGPLASVFVRKSTEEGKDKTPVLVAQGSTGSAITASVVTSIKDAFENAEIVTWKKKGDSMPGSREEMLPIMQFFARRLRSRAGVPAGAVEIT